MFDLSSSENSDTGRECARLVTGELMPAATADRLPEKSLDDDYIREYLREPAKGKTDALRRAGHPNPTRQRAYQLHARLADKIDKALDKQIKQDAALGRATLVELCKHSTSDSVRAACAAKLMEYADKAKPQRVIHEAAKLSDIDSEIAAIQRRLSEATHEG